MWAVSESTSSPRPRRRLRRRSRSHSHSRSNHRRHRRDEDDDESESSSCSSSGCSSSSYSTEDSRTCRSGTTGTGTNGYSFSTAHTNDDGESTNASDTVESGSSQPSCVDTSSSCDDDDDDDDDDESDSSVSYTTYTSGGGSRSSYCSTSTSPSYVRRCKRTCKSNKYSNKTRRSKSTGSIKNTTKHGARKTTAAPAAARAPAPTSNKRSVAVASKASSYTTAASMSVTKNSRIAAAKLLQQKKNAAAKKKSSLDPVFTPHKNDPGGALLKQQQKQQQEQQQQKEQQNEQQEKQQQKNQQKEQVEQQQNEQKTEKKQQKEKEEPPSPQQQQKKQRSVETMFPSFLPTARFTTAAAATPRKIAKDNLEAPTPTTSNLRKKKQQQDDAGEKQNVGTKAANSSGINSIKTCTSATTTTTTTSRQTAIESASHAVALKVAAISTSTSIMHDTSKDNDRSSGPASVASTSPRSITSTFSGSPPRRRLYVGQLRPPPPPPLPPTVRRTISPPEIPRPLSPQEILYVSGRRHHVDANGSEVANSSSMYSNTTTATSIARNIKFRKKYMSDKDIVLFNSASAKKVTKSDKSITALRIHVPVVTDTSNTTVQEDFRKVGRALSLNSRIEHLQIYVVLPKPSVALSMDNNNNDMTTASTSLSSKGSGPPNGKSKSKLFQRQKNVTITPTSPTRASSDLLSPICSFLGHSLTLNHLRISVVGGSCNKSAQHQQHKYPRSCTTTMHPNITPRNPAVERLTSIVLEQLVLAATNNVGIDEIEFANTKLPLSLFTKFVRQCTAPNISLERFTLTSTNRKPVPSQSHDVTTVSSNSASNNNSLFQRDVTGHQLLTAAVEKNKSLQILRSDHESYTTSIGKAMKCSTSLHSLQIRITANEMDGEYKHYQPYQARNISNNAMNHSICSVVSSTSSPKSNLNFSAFSSPTGVTAAAAPVSPPREEIKLAAEESGLPVLIRHMPPHIKNFQVTCHRFQYTDSIRTALLKTLSKLRYLERADVLGTMYNSGQIVSFDDKILRRIEARNAALPGILHALDETDEEEGKDATQNAGDIVLYRKNTMEQIVSIFGKSAVSVVHGKHGQLTTGSLVDSQDSTVIASPRSHRGGGAFSVLSYDDYTGPSVMLSLWPELLRHGHEMTNIPDVFVAIRNLAEREMIGTYHDDPFEDDVCLLLGCNANPFYYACPNDI